MQFFNTGNPQIDQLNKLGEIFGDPSKQAQAGYYGAETAKTLIDTQRQRFMNDKLYNLPTTLSAIPGLGGAGPTPGPGPAPGAAPPASARYAPPIPAPPSAPASPAPPGTPSPGPPSAVTPAALNAAGPMPAPSVGTDGQPQPPDPNLSVAGVFHPGSIQPPGGGTMNAPPAASNGSPAPVFDPVPYMTQLAQTGLPVEVQQHMAGAVLNGLVLSGRMDRVTANSLMARIGAPQAYESDQSTTRTGMTNATNITTEGMRNRTELERQRLQNQSARELAPPIPTLNPNDLDHPNLTPAPAVNTPGSTYQAPNTAQAADDNVQITVLAPDGKTLIPTTKGAWRRNQAMGRPMSADEMKTITIQPQGGGPGQLTYTGPAATQGQQPYDEAQSRYDNTNISIVTPTNEVITTTNGKLKANPGLGRAYDPTVDGAIVQSIDPATGKTVFTLARKAVTGGGAQVAPKTLDEANAHAVTRTAALDEAGNPLADTVAGAYQRAQLGLTPRQMINPDQHARMQLESDAHFQSMYPVPSGPHLFTSTGPVRPSDETQALHDEITRSLETTSYKTDPAAAATKAWDMMREAGVMDDPKTARSVGVRHLGTEDPRRTNAGELIINSDMTKVGNLKWPGAGPRGAPPNFSPPMAKTLPETVAPGPAKAPVPVPARATGPTAAPPGALGPAPPGAAEGQLLRMKGGGGMGRVQGGWVVPVQGAAAGAGAGGGGG